MRSTALGLHNVQLSRRSPNRRLIPDMKKYQRQQGTARGDDSAVDTAKGRNMPGKMGLQVAQQQDLCRAPV